MSIYKDGKLIAGGRQCMPLLSFMWADHILNDASWLRADTFSWQSGAVYQAVYAHLEDDIDGKTLQIETIAGTTIQFYLADDGHKICPASEESNVSAIYAATGVAWYYIIDTTNTRFKLPRTQFAFTGIRNGVGEFVEAGLPNITDTLNNVLFSPNGASASGARRITSSASFAIRNDGANEFHGNSSFDASRSSSVYGNSDTVQPKATEMYLYFYVGNFTQTALENTAGLNTELFNGKADVSTVAHVVTEFQAPTAANNYTWYRKYADGWVEQGGYYAYTTIDVNFQIVLPVSMESANYTIITTLRNNNTNAGFVNVDETSGVSATGFYCRIVNKASAGCSPLGVYWQVSGMAA
jgi:hypothetical protein